VNQFFAVHWVTLHGFVVFMGLAIYAIGSHTLRQRRHPSAAIAWFFSLILVPYVALPLYLMIGNRKVVTHPAVASVQSSPVPSSEWDGPLVKAGRLAKAMGLEDAVAYERLSIHQDGWQALQSLRDLIGNAKHTVDICTFILGADTLGREITQLLIQRAQEGIRIRLLIDGMGFYMGGRPETHELIAAGVKVVMFVPPFGSSLQGRTNLRNHRKMAIADGQWLWSGGRNIAAEYFEGDLVLNPKRQSWVDLSFDLRGALVRQAQSLFDNDWAFATNAAASKPFSSPVPNVAITAMMAQLVPSGPDQADDTIYSLLLSGCFTAHTRILAVSPYFVPDQALLQALTLAARRGVAVDLVLPTRSNHHLADIARHSFLRELVGAGASVWMAPGMVHAKAVIIDNDVALIGSANLDERSLFLNYELMVAFYDPLAVEKFSDWINLQKKSAAAYVPSRINLFREIVEGTVRLVAFQL